MPPNVPQMADSIFLNTILPPRLVIRNMNFNELPQVSDESGMMFSTEFRKSESEYTPEPVGCQRLHNMLCEGRH